MPRTLIDYRTLRELLDDYAERCEPHEVRLRDAKGDHAPADLLARLRPGELDAPLTRLASEGGNPAEITFRFPGGDHTYAVIWFAERYGWTRRPFGRTVHFYAPRSWIKNPPYCGATMLVSLCKRSFMRNEDPFWGEDVPDYCKTCSDRYRAFMNEIGE
jgi:hypothetical protein